MTKPSRAPAEGGTEGGTNVLGVVLAAGAGTRYGSPKIVARQGEWLRLAVAALAGAGCREVIVTMGARVVEPPAGSSAVVVSDWADGLSATVRAAVIEAGRRSWVHGMVLHVVDTPDVGADVVARVLSATGGRADRLGRAVFDGAPGHPVYIGVRHLDALVAGLDGDVGAGPYLRTHAREVIEVECGDLATGTDRDVAD
ncbi:NTP transferase domain-containing protein [Gordonia sp. CPCC 206044]|uniref:nucleotidyltransferase family protein n=1 Tax=Gordonia sp. CPCC 206044 TaxID=3140793 RepID=UPI003AF3C3FB